MKSDSKNKILVPVDFQEQSMVALEHTLNLFRLFDAEIVILFVVEQSVSLLNFVRPHDDYQEIREKALEKLENIKAESTKVSNATISVMVTKGKVYRSILETADEIGARLIVMGTNGTSGITKKFIGSNTLAVIKESKIPVITVKGLEQKISYRNIVLPLDLTKETKEKVAYAIQFARYFQSKIHIVSVLNVNIKEKESLIYQKMMEAKTKIIAEKIDCTTELVKDETGDIARIVIEYAARLKAGLIMIMTQQELDITEYFIGSHALEIIRESDIPVMSIVPSGKSLTTLDVLFDPFELRNK